MIVNQWIPQGETQHSAQRFLGAGFYNIAMEYFEATGGQVARMRWAGPGVGDQVIPPSAFFTHNRGFIAEFHDNTTLSGTPLVIRNDDQINFDWGSGAPQDRIGADNFSVRWRGKIEPPTTGNYTFYFASDDGADVFVNNQLLINRFGQPQGVTEYSGNINLEGGRKYYIDVRYVELTGGAAAQLRWSGPGISKRVVSRDFVYPILNEAPTDITISDNTVGDDDGANTVVGLLSTVDPDNTSGASPLQTHSYALVGGTGATHNGLFNLNGPELRINSQTTAGTYSIRLRTTDNGLIPDNQSFEKVLSIVVEDRTPPVITLSGAATINLECGNPWNDPGFTASDNVDGNITANVVLSGQTVNPNVPGTYVVRYNVQDAAGNPAVERTRTVNVADTTDPVITRVGSEVVNVECGSTYIDGGATAADMCAGDLSGAVVASGLPINTGVLGGNTVTYNVSDPTGNGAAPVTRTVNVVDTTPPVISLNGPSTIQVECGSAFVDPGVSVSDNCASGLEGSVVVSGDFVDTNSPGLYAVLYDVSDPSGNPAVQVSRTVVVSDSLAPLITLNGSASISVVAGQSFSDPGATAMDVCEGPVAVTVGGDTVDINTVDSYIITYDAEDSGGRAANQVTRTVNVVAGDPPVITRIGPATVMVECGDSYSDQGATANDPEDGDVTNDIVVNNPVDTSTPGTYTVTYNVQDSSGNAASEETRTVIVEDTQAPTLTRNGSANVTVECGDLYNDAGATASDACGGNLDSAIQVSGLPIDTSSPGVFTVTYNVSDSAGNAATSVQRTVTVIDSQAPVISLNGASVAFVNCGGAYNDAGATATDLCSGSLTGAVAVSGLPINTSNVGTYQVTYNVSDLAGNPAIPVIRSVVVQDLAPPTITLIGAETVVLEVGQTYTEQGAFALDDCEGTLSVAIGGDTIDTSTLGTYEVTYDAQDSTGNSAPQRTRTVVVTSGLPPVIIRQPEDATVNYSEDAIFEVNAAGLTALTYQWKRNGVDVPDNAKFDGVDTPVLIVRNTTALDEGAFTCEVRSGGSTTLTAPAQLTVNDPGILMQPADQLVGVGSTVVFEIEAAGSGTLAYQWQRNGLNLSNTGAYSGADTPILTITSAVKNLHEGNFRCVVTGDGGSASSEEAVLQIGDPIIVSNPNSLALNPGGTAQFSVVAEGDITLPLVYQWQRNGVNVQNGGRYSGANTPDLVISNVESGDAGTYTCRVVGQNIVVSQPAFLTVNEAPSVPYLEVLPASGITSLGGNISITVIVDGGAAPFTYQWQRNGVNLTDTTRISGSTEETLGISNAVLPNTGNYRCVVTNVAGTTVSAEVFIKVGLTMTTNLFTTLAEAGRPFTWSVDVAGNNGPVNYQWFKDDGAKAFLPLSDGPGISGTSSNTLLLNPADFSDSGSYQVVASDNTNTVPSNVATLEVVQQLNALNALLLALLAATMALVGPFVLRRRRLD